MSDNKSVSEIAQELGVTRQAVYQRVKKLSSSLQPFTVKLDNKTLYTLQGQKLIKQAFSSSESVKQTVNVDSKQVSSVDSKLIDTLTAQLEAKDRQIETLSKQLEVKDKQIDNLLESLKAAQLLHAAEKQQPKVIEVSQEQTHSADNVHRAEQTKVSAQRPGTQRQKQHNKTATNSQKSTLFDRITGLFHNKK